MKLNNLAVGEIVSVFHGPWIGSNYGGTETPVVHTMLRMIGGGSAAVKLQYNITPIYGYDNGSLMLVPDPTGWVDVATINTEGLTSTDVVERGTVNWLRVVVSTAGPGFCEVGGLWAKR